jgi:hypothetical protein
MTPQGFNENSRLRASDADRDRAASVINNALAEGRLTAEEHSDRLDAIYAAKTHGELVPVLDDLPAAGTAPAPFPTSARTQVTPAGRGSRIVAIFGGASRKGVWHPEPHMQIVTVFGGAELDFRQAVLPGQEVTVHATTVLGGLEIVVPPEMRVIDNGVAILGGREVAGDSPESAAEGAPVLRIEGTCVLGGVEVKRKRRKQPGGPGIRGLRDQIRQQRHEVHRAVHEQRHQVRDQIRQQRRELRQGWAGDDYE